MQGNVSVLNSQDEYSIAVQTQRGIKDFQFDQIFMEDSTQEKIFEDTNVRYIMFIVWSQEIEIKYVIYLTTFLLLLLVIYRYILIFFVLISDMFSNLHPFILLSKYMADVCITSTEKQINVFFVICYIAMF